jgi:signal transduction histidine kinase
MTSWVHSLVLPLVAAFAALGAAKALQAFGASQVLFLFVPAVMIAAWYGGRTGSLVATAMSVLLMIAFVIAPDRASWWPAPGDALSVLIFIGICISIGFVVADRRRSERERERALRDAEAARHDAEISSRLKDQFLATLSHELRTPLNAVLGWARMLVNQQVDDRKVPAALAMIERNAQAQKQLVDDLLDVSAIVSGRLRLEPRDIDLAEVVRTAVDSMKLSFEARHHRLEQQLEPVRIVGDADRLRQVVWNLLSNAAKFTPEGGDIFIRVDRDGATARLWVRDTGRGIGAEFLPHVFEPFRQADSSITRTSGGLGLGLSLVRHLVEAHGGTVTVTSEGPMQGTTFMVALPAHGGAAVSSSRVGAASS